MFFFVLFKVISSEESLILFTRGEGRPASGGGGGLPREGEDLPSGDLGLHPGGGLGRVSQVYIGEGVGQKPLGLPRGRGLVDPPAKSEKWVLRILLECFLVFTALKYM